MNYRKLTAVFMVLGITAASLSGCGFAESGKKAENSKVTATATPEPTKTVAAVTVTEAPVAAVTETPVPVKEEVQEESDNHTENTPSENSTPSEPEKEITYISGVLTDSDESSVTIEYGSDGNFSQTTFDISHADIQIGGSQKQGGPLAASLNLEIGYYVQDGNYIAVSVYGDGSESMTPSWIYNYEQERAAEEE